MLKKHPYIRLGIRAINYPFDEHISKIISMLEEDDETEEKEEDTEENNDIED